VRLENILRAQAMRRPDKIALICGDERLTYRELELRVQRVANGLRKRGAGPGDRICPVSFERR
jgi:long-chain acyl-CoA synthetase